MALVNEIAETPEALDKYPSGTVAVAPIKGEHTVPLVLMRVDEAWYVPGVPYGIGLDEVKPESFPVTVVNVENRED